MRRSSIGLGIVLLAWGSAALACSLPGIPGSVVGAAATTVSATLTAIAGVPTVPVEPSTTPEPTPYPPHPPFVWMCYQCGGSEAWRVGPETAVRFTLPVSIGQFYSYNPATDQIAYAQTFADHGAGPGTIAVSDLSLLTAATGDMTTVFPENVVEALWSPDGVNLAYILATPSTYELRVTDLAGTDRLLASDVSFTWSFSPSGEAIAFTRESGYETPGTPGLYVVSVLTGVETMVSNVDKSGTGSIDDRPTWTLDSEYVVLSHYGGPSPARVVMARADGSASWDLTVDEALSSNWWYTPSISNFLWFPGGTQALGLPTASMEMGGPPPIILFTHGLATHILGGGTELGTVIALIDWDVPGETFWALNSEGEVVRMTVP